MMDGLFYNCYSLTSIDLSSFNTQNIENITYLFFNSTNLTYIDISSFDGKTQYSPDCFTGLPESGEIKLNDFNFDKVDIPKNWTKIRK